MTKLLDALGLPPAPPNAAPTRTPTASASPTPTGLGMRPAEDKSGKQPDNLGLPGLDLPKNGNLADPKKPIDLKLPDDPQKQVDLLADAIARTQDAAKRDKLVKLLRDAIARIQPVMSDADAKKEINKLIDKGIDAAGKAALLKIIELVVGRGPSQAPDPDQPHPTGPNVKEKDLGEHILKTPEIPFGKPPATHRNSFEFRGLPKSTKAGGFLDVQLLTPDWFHPDPPATWLTVVTAEAYKQKNLRGYEHEVHLDSKGTLRLTIHLPDEPGSYVVVIKNGDRAEQEPEPIELK